MMTMSTSLFWSIYYYLYLCEEQVIYCRLPAIYDDRFIARAIIFLCVLLSLNLPNNLMCDIN